tara:strand:+ start:229 stop:483 length:255 start_codon:yes stop_codon:yes gene_type:complete
MSGDNIHGKQPVKFYSDELTHTKLSLLEMKLKPLYSDREYALILDALERRRTNFIAGDKMYREYGALIKDMEKRSGVKYKRIVV